MRTWMISAFVHIQWLTLCVCALLFHVIRDFGEGIYVLQAPTDAVLHFAADVEDTARIQAQWLIVHLL